MPADQFAIPVVLLERFTALGVDVPRMVERAGLPMARFRGDKARLTTGEFLALWRALEVEGGRDVGLRLATAVADHQHDVASIAALHSATFGEALQKMARYKRLCCPEEITIEAALGEARVRFHWVLAEGALPLALVDVTFASALALARRGTGLPVTPLRLELSRRRGDPASLQRHFGCEVRFDAAIDLLVFDERLLARPMVTQNPDLVAMLIPSLEAALEEGARGATLADDVRRALRRRMGGERPSVDKVAEDLRTSARTLQRRLGALGTSYQALLDETRRRVARELLTTTDLDVGEVAFLLGFEELNSFNRAFHGWEGASPSRWRQAAAP